MCFLEQWSRYLVFEPIPCTYCGRSPLCQIKRLNNIRLFEMSWEKFKDQVYRSSDTISALSSELNKIIDNNTLINLEDNLRKLIQPTDV